MPDRYGEHDEPIVDLDSRRQARENQAAIERAQAQRERLADSRATHAPLSATQSDELRRHRGSVTNRAENARNALRIANCTLCNDDGYRGSIICDHVDHRPAYDRGMTNLRETMGWD